MDVLAQPVDRRQRRRLETIEEALDVAAEVMAEQGVAGLSIGEVARRLGIRPPSLYVYFESKNALYDGLFARGARLALEVTEPAVADGAERPTLAEALLVTSEALVRWSVENPAYSQLIFWRPVPGYEPSADAYAPAVRLLEVSTQGLRRLAERGLLRPDVPVEQVLRDWTVLLAGVVSQQLANAPGERYDHGRFTAALPELVAMFARHYGRIDGPPQPPTTSVRRAPNADRR